MRLTLFSVFVLSCLAQISQAYEHATHTNGILRGPYLQFATPNSIYVVWRTHGQITPVVRWGTDADRLDHEIAGPAIITRYGTTNKHVSLPEGVVRLHSAREGCYQYEANLTNLAPDTLYYYDVFNGDIRMTDRDPSSFHFRTHPLPGTPKPIRIWVVGDSGTGRPKETRVHTSMLDLVASEKHPLDFYIHLGDM